MRSANMRSASRRSALLRLAPRRSAPAEVNDNMRPLLAPCVPGGGPLSQDTELFLIGHDGGPP